jgi:hypothetical protein
MMKAIDAYNLAEKPFNGFGMEKQFPELLTKEEVQDVNSDMWATLELLVSGFPPGNFVEFQSKLQIFTHLGNLRSAKEEQVLLREDVRNLKLFHISRITALSDSSNDNLTEGRIILKRWQLVEAERELKRILASMQMWDQLPDNGSELLLLLEEE